MLQEPLLQTSDHHIKAVSYKSKGRDKAVCSERQTGSETGELTGPC